METISFNGSENQTRDLVSLIGPKRDNLYIVIPMTIIYAIIFLTGLIGNVSTCIVIARNKSMHTATNYYLFSLAISDLLLLICGLPPEIYLMWSRYPYVFGYTFCILRGLFAETSANATVLTITAFTVERYVAICHPFLSHTLAKLSRIVKMIILIWIVAVCFAIPQALQFGTEILVEGQPESEICNLVNPIIEHSFEVSSLLFFFAPMTLITVLYILIGIRLKSSTNMMKKESGELMKSLGTKNLNDNERTSRRHQSNQSSRRILKMLVAVVVAFFICWAPFHAQRLFYIYALELKDGALKIYEIMTYISGILYYLSTTINPLLYNIMSNKFRDAFKETFSRCCCMARQGHPQRSYSALSRSAQRGPDSTDSGRDDPSVHTHSTLIHKNSSESYTATQRYCGKKQLEKPGSSEIDNPVIYFPLAKDRSDVRITVAPKTNYENIQPNTRLVAVHVTTARQTKFSKFMQFFHCIARKTMDDGKRLTTYYSSPTRDGNAVLELKTSNKMETFSLTSGEISNSSLRNFDNNDLEDELTTYMVQIRCQELTS